MPRKPRDIERYDTVEAAARALEHLAQNLRSKGGMAKFVISLNYWNPDWQTDQNLKTIVTQVTYINQNNHKREDG